MKPSLSFSLSLIGLATAMMLSSPELSAAEVFVDAAAPAENVLAANSAREPAATVGWKHDGMADQWIGITFQVSKSVVLDKISLAFANVGSGAAGTLVTLQVIRLAPAASFSDRLQQATVLQTDTFTLPAEFPESGWLTFDLADIELPESPEMYGYVLSFNKKGNNRHINFVVGNGDADGAIAIGESNAAFRSETGEGAYAALGNAKTGTAAFPQVVFIGREDSGAAPKK